MDRLHFAIEIVRGLRKSLICIRPVFYPREGSSRSIPLADMCSLFASGILVRGDFVGGAMRRRDFVAFLASFTVASCILPARAQQHDRRRRIGVLMGLAESDPQARKYLD